MTTKRIRDLLKKSSILVKIVRKYRFFRHFTLKDLIDFKKIKLFWIAEPYTMVGYYRLTNAYELACLAEKNNIGGAFVECGVWKGGCIAVMAYAANKALNRKIWLFDSFTGLPEPQVIDGKEAKEYASGRNLGRLKSINECSASIEDVEEIFFARLGINRKNVIINKGWLQNVLPQVKNALKPIAILRLDVDWYESTKVCLENLYDHVVPGGYIIIDDYGHWEGCRKAVDEFFKKREIKVQLSKIDYTGRYFQKQ